jgi:hypothetical protein
VGLIFGEETVEDDYWKLTSRTKSTLRLLPP